MNIWLSKGNLDPALADKVAEIDEQVEGGHVPKNYLPEQMKQVIVMMQLRAQAKGVQPL